jgi:hypothetical protein
MVNKSFQEIVKVITPDVVTMLVNMSTPPAEENQS